MICFADLKKYKFTYLFGFPALHSEPSWVLSAKQDSESLVEESSDNSVQSGSRLNGKETTALVDAVQTWRYSVDVRQYGFFLAKRRRYGFLGNVNNKDQDSADESRSRPGTPGDDLGYQWIIGPLASFDEGFFEGTDEEDRFICFADPSTYDVYPGWMLRNLLVLVRRKWNLQKAQILCYRDIAARRHEARSIILRLEQRKENHTRMSEASNATANNEMPKTTGWERNSAGKVMSKIANLGEYMDPQR